MKQRKFAGLFLALSMALSLTVVCGDIRANASEAQQSAGADEGITGENTEQEAGSEENQAAAEQLLIDLEGTYQELWPVVLAEEYHQVWLDASAELVGEENAEAAVEMLASMVTGTVTGEEAVEAYKDGGMAYCCEFLGDVEQFTFDGATISGADADGKELFRHSYHYAGMEEIRGLYVYESDDADSGEFTYFCMAPDTMDTTWHIEFRYGSDLEALGQYDAGDYAYWLASGISVDHTEEDVKNSILLFCGENLSE